ncbi:MAG TPA: hypothetical protein VE377_22545, partial [Candidatus Dormibacteraeota bacterium]|nr:hypothetical protein [Candidatus Dormibacteraeota bacterium]
FGELARMTLAGWDEKSSLAAASDPQTTTEVLEYFISIDNLRPKLLPALLENPSVTEKQLVKLATSAMRDIVDVILKSPRAKSFAGVRDTLRSNPYLRKEEIEELRKFSLDAPKPIPVPDLTAPAVDDEVGPEPEFESPGPAEAPAVASSVDDHQTAADSAGPVDDETVAAYLKEHAHDIAAEGEKPFQAIGGIVELLGQDFFPVLDSEEITPPPAPEPSAAPAPSETAAKPAIGIAPKKPPAPPKRENTMQKINALDVKGRIQLALKGNKEERSILIRDGTKVVALAVLEAPKLADGEVEKFASQKNVLEAVLRQIPLKRRFMKNYIVVRNLVGNPRTPLDLGLGLMKNLLIGDLKNLSANKEISETVRKLALKMYKQKLDAANKK